jgi:hypothetical protein
MTGYWIYWEIFSHTSTRQRKPGSIFQLVGTPVRVPTVEAMEALIPTWEDPRVPLGRPYTGLDPETEVVCPRNSQLVPGRYTAFIVHRRRIKAKQAYQEIIGAIRADKLLDVCNNVQLALNAGAGAQNALPNILHLFVPLHLPPEVYQYVTQKVKQDLPAANALEGPPLAPPH